MATAVQRRRGTRVQNSTFVGQEGEFTYNKTRKLIEAHDGNQPGGYPTDYTFNLHRYGFSPTGTPTSNTAAWDACVADLKAALATAGTYAGRIIIPPGVYEHNGLTLVPSSDRHSIDIIGLCGAAGVTLKYMGAGGVGLTIKNNVYFHLENFELADGGTGATGILLQSVAGGGAATGNIIAKNIVIGGFTTGLHIGSATDAAADVLKFINTNIQNCTTGILIEGINGITIGFENLCGNNCTTFLKFAGDTGYNKNVLRIQGGGIVDCGTDLRIEAACHLSVDNWYSEGSVAGNRFLDVIAGAIATLPIYVCVKNCESFQSAAAASRLYWAGHYRFENTHHETTLEIGNNNAGDCFSLVRHQCLGAVTTYKAGASSFVRVSEKMNGGNFTNNQAVQDEEEFVFLSGGTKKTLWKYGWSDAANLATITPFGFGLGKHTTLTVNSATPSVAGNNMWRTLNTAATTISNLTGGVEGQVYVISFQDNNTTVQFSAGNIRGNGAADKVMSNGDALILWKGPVLWYAAVIDGTP
jgi:hypothetical protein